MAIHWRGSGHSVNRRTLKIVIICAHPLPSGARQFWPQEGRLNNAQALCSCPRGPEDQKNLRFRARFKVSSENGMFERATHRGPIFVGEIETSRLKFSRAELKVTDLRCRSPICGFLRFSAKIFGLLRKSAPSKCLNFQEKGWICENLGFSAKICVLGSYFRPLQRAQILERD